MNYDFRTLNHADFEDLARDLIGQELSVRFEAFAQGPDGGIDGRYSSGSHQVILQAKHYVGSNFSTLKSKLAFERQKVANLAPSRYVLVTSQDLTPANKQKLVKALDLSCLVESDIWGASDLNAALRRYPDVERSHIKLWLSSSAVLTHILRATSDTYNKLTYEDVSNKVKVFATNPSLKKALDIIEQTHALIISGPPGVGKTTLAEMLAFSYVSNGWEFNAIRTLDDGFATLNDKKNQIFLFDDFLGQIALDSPSLLQKDSDIHKFLQKVSRSPNVRFVLTTRAYIFEEAKRNSEHLSSPLLEISKYVLDVGVYTREIKARILYNHLVVHKTPYSYIENLLKDNNIKKIIDHKNYNPRVVSWMTSEIEYLGITADKYSNHFLSILENPKRLWQVAFDNHISKKCHNLLFALFFCDEQGVDLDRLKKIYNKLHASLSKKYGESFGPKDFEESLQILEGSFVAMHGKIINFMNPSVRDFLDYYLADESIISEFPESARDSQWARSLWTFGKKVIKDEDKLSTFALSFTEIASELTTLPVHIRSNRLGGRKRVGLSNINRIHLLLEWWELSSLDDFFEHALLLSQSPVDGFDPWLDADEVIELIGNLRSNAPNELSSLELNLADNLESSLKHMMVQKSIDLEDAERIVEAGRDNEEYLSDNLLKLITESVELSLCDADSDVATLDSVSELEYYIETVRNIGEKSEVDSLSIETAVGEAESRISELENEEKDLGEEDAPEFNERESDGDDFNDDDINDLFSSLLDNEENELIK